MFVLGARGCRGGTKSNSLLAKKTRQLATRRLPDHRPYPLHLSSYQATITGEQEAIILRHEAPDSLVALAGRRMTGGDSRAVRWPAENERSV